MEEVTHGVEHLTLAVSGNAGRAAEVEDRIAGSAEGDALEGGGEEAAAPVGGAAARPARTALQDDEAGQILRLAAEAVGHPGPHARPAELRRAGVEKNLRRGVV